MLHVVPTIGALAFGTGPFVMLVPSGIAKTFRDVDGQKRQIGNGWRDGVKGGGGIVLGSGVD
jgi:hypothetical protein